MSVHNRRIIIITMIFSLCYSVLAGALFPEWFPLLISTLVIMIHTCLMNITKEKIENKDDIKHFGDSQKLK